jgi:hypothetical protein
LLFFFKYEIMLTWILKLFVFLNIWSWIYCDHVFICNPITFFVFPIQDVVVMATVNFVKARLHGRSGLLR